MNEYLIGNTLVDMPRLEKIAEYLEQTAHTPGDIAEVGVYRGGTARWIAERAYTRVFLFDTFSGMPEVSKHDLHRKGDFDDTSIEHVAALLEGCHNVSLYQGVFPCENAQYVEFRTFSFVHLDVDIYDSVKECLEFFAPRMNKGGIIALDDYNEPDCPGAKLAADEFAAANGLVVESTVQSQAIIRF